MFLTSLRKKTFLCVFDSELNLLESKLISNELNFTHECVYLMSPKNYDYIVLDFDLNIRDRFSFESIDILFLLSLKYYSENSLCMISRTHLNLIKKISCLNQKNSCDLKNADDEKKIRQCRRNSKLCQLFCDNESNV
jgi:hypothetical protein